ncbi:hypothetical protein ABIB37_000323 [Agrococcus sp. UYP10]|uniref:hypothetical protein n=1 Tax=Agrococcus sp. UYP10 TaxID=1756355 RepID=UPI003391FBEE
MRDSDSTIWQRRVRVQRSGALRADLPTAEPWRESGLARIRHGVYAPAAELEAAGHGVRYLARIEATAEMRSSPTFARESALALHGLPYGAEPDRVFTIGDLRTAGLKAGVQHARVELDAEDVVEVHGMQATSVPYALADLARRRDQRVAVAAIDAALHEQRCDREEIAAALSRQSRVGRSRAEAALAFADGGAESVGESWSRVVLQLLGFPAPQVQPRVRGASGRMWEPDFGWTLPELPRPLLGEFDGQEKYGRLAAADGLTPAQALAREKAREDDLRVEHDIARWIWIDLLEPARLERLLLAHRLPRIRRPSLWLPPAA